MPLSYQEITNPSTTSFTVNFEFLNLADIKAVTKYSSSTASWTERAVTNAATDSAGVTTVTVASSSTSSTGKLRIYRESTQEPIVDFQNGSLLSERDLDTAYRQGLFAAQEVRENAKEQIAVQGPVGDSGANGADAVITAGSIANDKLANSSVTINGSAVALGGSTTITTAGDSCAFSVYRGSAPQTLTSSTTTKIEFNNTLYDIDSAWSSSTHKFTAPYSGYYTFKSSLGFQGTSISRVILFFFKDGVEYQRGADLNVTGASIIHGSCDMYLSLNQTCEVHGYVTGSSAGVKNPAETWFSGFKLA